MCIVKNWDDLKVVLALSQHKTMTAAAKSLGMNTGTVSRRLERFTQEVGKTLFVRRGNDWEPTSTALPMIRAADHLKSELNREPDFGEAGSDVQRVLRISVDPEVMAEAISPNLANLLRENPKLSVDFLAQEASVALGEADLAVGFREPVAGRLVRAKLGVMEYRAFMHSRWNEEPQGYIEYIATERAPSNCIASMKSVFGRPKMATKDVHSAIKLMSDYPMAMCLPTRLGNAHADLAVMPMDFDASRFPVWASFHESRRLDPDVRLALEFARGCFNG